VNEGDAAVAAALARDAKKLTRKEQEELDKRFEVQKREHLKTEQAKVDLDRLAAIRRRREEQKAKREAEDEAAKRAAEEAAAFHARNNRK
jgi:hypothetical protein